MKNNPHALIITTLIVKFQKGAHGRVSGLMGRISKGQWFTYKGKSEEELQLAILHSLCFVHYLITMQSCRANPSTSKFQKLLKSKIWEK